MADCYTEFYNKDNNMKYIFIGMAMIVSVLMSFDAWKTDNIASLLGWAMAFGFQAVLFLQDIFESSSEEIDKLAKKRLDAFNKLLRKADESGS